MNYKEKLESVETLSQLIDFREELLSDEKKFSSDEESGLNMDNLRKCQNANFWLPIVNERIRTLFSSGLNIDKIAWGKAISGLDDLDFMPEIKAGSKAIELLRKMEKFISVPTNSIGFNSQFEIEIKSILSKLPVDEVVS